MRKSVDVLGAKYSITRKKYDEDPAFAKSGINGYCDYYNKKIVYCEMASYPGWENENEADCKTCERETVRHEIVHAFLNESGLRDCALQSSGSWAKNEEMVDWIALQGQRIWIAWVTAEAV